MGGLSDRVDRIAQNQIAKTKARSSDLENRRAQFRRDMPEVAGVVDLLRSAFGDDCRVLFANEGGNRIKTNRAKWLGIDD